MMTTLGEDHANREGIRVDGRCWSVDFLENALTFGKLNQILETVIKAADLSPGDRMLDVGCGSGRLLIEASRRFPECRFHGVDATPGMIDRARTAAAEQNSPVTFNTGLVQTLPFDDASLDAVVSSFLIHHLPDEIADDAFVEMNRVLKPGGRLVIADYGRPESLWGYIASFPMWWNFYEYVRPQLKGRLQRLFDRHFPQAACVKRFNGYLPVLVAVKQ